MSRVICHTQLHVIPVLSYSRFFIVNFEHFSHLSLVFLWLALKYFESNVRRSMEYCRCNLLLPEYLYNRLYPFTKHCAEEIELAKAIGGNSIRLLNVYTNNA